MRWSILLAFVVAGCGSDKKLPYRDGTHEDAAPPGGADSGSNSATDGGTPSNAAELTVTLADGKLLGELVGGTRRFLKIPFAKPPLGDLRWKAPVKNDPWSGVRHETSFSGGCAQNKSAQGEASTNEDCLYLNVWSPDPAPQKAPVMVWFHGGGNFAGAAGDSLPGAMPPVLWYDGQFFAKRHGVVVVTIEYRLGPMGFFSHPALADEKSPLGNQGLLDQRRSLEWVRDNVSKFGGDPANVTIFGESAGSGDVCYHVASPGSRGLFHRAVSQSGGCTVSFSGGRDATSADTAAGMKAFAKALGCDTAKDVLSCLRAKPIDEIMANAQQPDPTSGAVVDAPWSFGVVVDGPGGFLPDQARKLFDAGDVAKVPYLMGSNNDEGTLFLLGATAPMSEADYADAVKARFGANTDAILAMYPVSKFDGDYKAALARVIGDSGLVCGTHDSARRAAKAGLPVFMYNFNVPWAIAPELLHASHASEMSHVFGNPFTRMPDPDSVAVGDAMNAFWAEFAKRGDPNFDGAPAKWPPFSPDAKDDDERLQLDPKWETLKSFRKEECAFWRGLYDQAS